jgi:hypothetical protein
MQNIEKQILKRLDRKNRGTLLFPDDFIDLGSMRATKPTLEVRKEISQS